MPARRLSEMKTWSRIPVFPDATGEHDPYILVRADDADFWRTWTAFLEAERQRLNAAKAEAEKFLDEAERRAALAQIDETRIDPDGHKWIEVSCGRTFGGFGNILGPDDQPLADGRPGELNVEACRAVLNVAEVNDAWTTARNRLKRERQARWEGTVPNPPAATVN